MPSPHKNLYKAPLKLRAYALTLCTVCFFIVYIMAGLYAEYREINDSILLPGERDIPFIAWFIIPYTSSSLLFVYQFYLSVDKRNLRLLTYRILFITICAGFMFLFFPLRFKFEKPMVDNYVLDSLVHLFRSYDTPYNQAPSLHVSFACIFYTVILQQNFPVWKNVLWLIWVVLIILSTVFVYQHHAIDVITAMILVVITLFIFPSKYLGSN